MVKIFTSIYQFMIWTFHYVVGGDSSTTNRPPQYIHMLEYRPLQTPGGNLSTKTNPLKSGRKCVQIIVQCRYNLSVMIIIYLQSRLPQEFVFVTVNFNILCTARTLVRHIYRCSKILYTHTCAMKHIFKRVTSGLYNEGNMRSRSICLPAGD